MYEYMHLQADLQLGIQRPIHHLANQKSTLRGAGVSLHLRGTKDPLTQAVRDSLRQFHAVTCDVQ
jgi:hypothetical protein